MGYYYHDPSGLGVWYVNDGQSPAQALDAQLADTGATVSPILFQSVANSPVAQKVNGGAPTRSPGTVSPPPPTTYVNQGASVVPVRPTLTQYQLDNSRQGKYTQDPAFTGNGGGIISEDCGDGYFFDDWAKVCRPLITFTPIPIGGTATSTISSINILVNNAVSLSDGVGQAIADVVDKGITGAVDQAKAAAADAAQAVEGGIQQTVDAVDNAATGLISKIQHALSYVFSGIASTFSAIWDYVKGPINDVIGAVTKLSDKIYSFYTDTLKPFLDKVNDVINNTIAPIFNTISQVYEQTKALVEAIKQDVSAGLTGILQIPGQVAQSTGAIVASIERTLGELGLKKKDNTSVFLDKDGIDSIYDRLKAVGHGVDILGNVGVDRVTFADMVKLSEPNLARAGAANVNALAGEITDFVSTLHANWSSISDHFKALVPLGLPLLGAEVGTWIGIWELFRSIEELFEPFYKFAKEDLAGKAGLSKLPVGEALAAWKRKAITDDELTKELEVHGWDAGRIKKMRDLQGYVVDVGTALDMQYRGLLSADELTNALAVHGITADQKKALLDQSKKLFNVELAATQTRWGNIDDPALTAVLKENRYSDTEITAFKATMYDLESPDDVLKRVNASKLYTGLGFDPTHTFNTDSDFTKAVQRSGRDASVAATLWKSSFFVPPLAEWIELYFRGVRTITELHLAMDYYRVPVELRDDLIRARRSILPFRSIPTMLANGLISEPYAREQLQAHGYDLPAIEALLKYASIATQKKKVAPSGDLHALSIQTIRHYFDLGTLSPEQYKTLLLEHGYDEASADLTIQVETQHAAALQRKQQAADLVDEVLAGTITLDSALSQADNLKFSPTEKSKLANTINRAQRKVVKVPGEGELHSMAKAGAIDEEQYKSALAQSGWSQAWIDIFVKWRFPSATPSAAPA
jgi:hypothetical protein